MTAGEVRLTTEVSKALSHAIRVTETAEPSTLRAFRAPSRAVTVTVTARST
jgi:hypothetical protein